MPYISASIILMLLGEVVPSLHKLRQEGQTGYKKIQEYTRYLTVLLCVIQAMMYLKMMGQYAYPGMYGTAMLLGVIGMTAGTIFLMWSGRADRRIRHRQRHQPYHHGRHPGENAMGDRPFLVSNGLVGWRRARQVRTSAVDFPFGVLRVCGCRSDPDYTGTAANSHSAGQADARPADVWRPTALSAAAS